jgi:uncharacterized protein YuzE
MARDYSKDKKYAIGTKFNHYARKHNAERTIIDILTTTNSEGKVVGIEYVTESTFMGQRMTDTITASGIARSLFSN